MQRPGSTNTATRDQIAALGRRVEVVECDLADLEGVKGVFPHAVEKMGDIHVLVNCGGIQRRAPAVEFAEADWDEVRSALRRSDVSAWCSWALLFFLSFVSVNRTPVRAPVYAVGLGGTPGCPRISPVTTLSMCTFPRSSVWLMTWRSMTSLRVLRWNTIVAVSLCRIVCRPSSEVSSSLLPPHSSPTVDHASSPPGLFTNAWLNLDLALSPEMDPFVLHFPRSLDRRRCILDCDHLCSRL